jgi:hypothetical protein
MTGPADAAGAPVVMASPATAPEARRTRRRHREKQYPRPTKQRHPPHGADRPQVPDHPRREPRTYQAGQARQAHHQAVLPRLGAQDAQHEHRPQWRDQINRPEDPPQRRVVGLPRWRPFSRGLAGHRTTLTSWPLRKRDHYGLWAGYDSAPTDGRLLPAYDRYRPPRQRRLPPHPPLWQCRIP